MEKIELEKRHLRMVVRETYEVDSWESMEIDGWISFSSASDLREW